MASKAPDLSRRCRLCGAAFLLESTLARHRAAELAILAPAFMADAEAKQRAYEAGRRRYRMAHPFVTREELAEREAAAGVQT